MEDFGEDLSNESGFLEEAKEKAEESFESSDCSFYCGEIVMTFSVELSITPTAEIARKILNGIDGIADVYFAKKKTFHQIGLCSSYMLDKRILESRYLTEYSWLNISPNRRLYRKQGENF